MKNLSLLILLIASFILFLIGVSIPGTGTVLHIVLVVAGTVLGFTFYVLTFMQVLKTPSLSPGRRVFWIVVIVCLPMIGNLIYVIVHDADVRKQVPSHVSRPIRHPSRHKQLYQHHSGDETSNVSGIGYAA